ncbi:zinc finger MYM-type protein 1-like [Aphis gossypii]|uniref:zinc finger MYM-type protein 1-like n=1 Tax=Aphis gossypii TaxID=80765 RepID=UPI002158A508|nr:zinc finger MYM-type protein 1-like [Aphis gossypii]
MNPVYDPVVQLLGTPFRRWTTNDKNELLKLGKPIPQLCCQSRDKKGGKMYSRAFNPKWYDMHTWLCGSQYKQALYCWPCLLLSMTKSVWTTTGYADLKNLSRSVKLHESAREHIHCMVGLKHLENNRVTIVDALTEHGYLFKKKYNENVRLNRLFMEHLIDIVLFLGRQELAFRGHNESSSSLNKGNFKELFDMHIIRCSLEIQNHYKAIKNIFSGLSNTIQNDLITCISDHIKNMVRTEIKECMFYSVQVDDTTDISQKTQCSIILRYMTNKSELVERFLGFYNVSEDRTAEGLFNTLNSVLLELDMEKKLIGQCYDGASVMAGHVNGLQAKVKEVAPNALFTHCLAHRLNLVLQHGCSANTQCRIFFANMTGISAFFHNSTSRTNVVDAIVGKRIPQFVQTRWASRSKILNLVVDKWDEFKKVFEHIIKDSNSSSESICGSIGHLNNLKKFEFAFLAQTFNRGVYGKTSTWYILGNSSDLILTG